MKKRTPQQAGAIIRERREALRLIQDGISDVSGTLIYQLEEGKAPEKSRGPARATFFHALGWPGDAYNRLLAGEDPATFKPASSAVVELDRPNTTDALRALDAAIAALSRVREHLAGTP